MPVLALIFGICTVLGAFVTDTAPNGTHNIGLMQQQMMTLQVGLVLLIIAAIRWDRPAASEGRYAPPARTTSAEPIERFEYEKPKGLDTQQLVIAGVLVVVIIGVAIMAFNS